MALFQSAAAQAVNKPTGSTLLSYQELDILHALRGFCAFYVVVYHAKYILWSGGTEYLVKFPRATWTPLQYLSFAADISSAAGVGMVIFFFVLSGFFIRYAQLKKHRATLRFYLNRAVRIYPSYLASLVLGSCVIVYLAHQHPQLLTTALGRELNTGLLGTWQEMHLPLAATAQSLLFLRPGTFFVGYNQVYWSLLPEALFYLSVPLAFWRVRYYYVLSAACFLVGTGAVALHFNTSFFGGYLFTYNAYFALGAGLYDVVTRRPGWLAAFRRINGVWLALTLSVLFVVLVATSALQHPLATGPLAAVLAVLSVSVLLAGRVNRQNPVIRLFHEIGIFSFSLYLYHYPLLILCYAGLSAMTGALVIYPRYYWLCIPLVTAGCFALYYVTERPAVRYFRGT